MAPSAIAEELNASAAAPGAKSCTDKVNAKAPGYAVPSDALSQEAASHLDPFYEIIEQPIGTRRPIRVACLGAGYSGLMMSIVFSQKMQGKNAELVVYERNEDLGGTWFENRYAGTTRLAFTRPLY